MLIVILPVFFFNTSSMLFNYDKIILGVKSNLLSFLYFNRPSSDIHQYTHFAKE